MIGHEDIKLREKPPDVNILKMTIAKICWLIFQSVWKLMAHYHPGRDAKNSYLLVVAKPADC